MTTLILYTFHEYNDNVKYFIKKGLIDDRRYKFIMIANADVKLELPSYVELIVRENNGYDFGAWSSVIHNHRNYDKYIFMNSSVYGPIIPSYCERNWVDILTSGINDYVKLYGCTLNNGDNWGTINPFTNAHIQSCSFCTDNIGLDILIKTGIFEDGSTNSMNKNDIVNNKEIKMSRNIVDAGYNIGCLMERYKNVDFRKCEKYNRGIFIGDVYFNYWFSIGIINKYEIMFVKTTRDISKNFYVANE